MTAAEDRGRFLEILRSEGVPERMGRTVLRYAATLTRLAVAHCNGDWPCDNGVRPVLWCTECEGGMVASKMVKGVCEDCRTVARLTVLLAPLGIVPQCGGDPRGVVVALVLPSGRADNGDHTALCVPS